VAQQLGGLGGGLSSGLIRKLLPMLAPIVMSYIAKRMRGGGGQQQANSGGGGLGDLLGGLLQSGLGGGGGGQSSGGGGILAGRRTPLGDLPFCPSGARHQRDKMRSSRAVDDVVRVLCAVRHQRGHVRRCGHAA